MEEREMALQPTDTKLSPYSRLYKELAVYEPLDNLNIPYLRLDYEVTASVEDCHDVDRI